MDGDGSLFLRRVSKRKRETSGNVRACACERALVKLHLAGFFDGGTCNVYVTIVRTHDGGVLQHCPSVATRAKLRQRTRMSRFLLPRFAYQGRQEEGKHT